MEIITALGAVIVGALFAGVGAKNKPLRPELEAWINDLHPQAQNKFRELIAEIEKRGYVVSIQSGYRSFEKQAQLYASGQTPAAAGASFHNYGLALDINMAKNGQVWRMASGRAAWLATGIPQIAEQMGFTWGGRFGGYYAANGDNVHFHLPIAPTAELYQLAQNQNVAGNKINLSAIGAIYRGFKAGTRRCFDEHYSDARAGACSYHGGLYANYANRVGTIYNTKKKNTRKCIDSKYSDAQAGACSYHGGLEQTITNIPTQTGDMYFKILYKLRFEGGKNLTPDEQILYKKYKKSIDEIASNRAILMQVWDIYLPKGIHTKRSLAIDTLIKKLQLYKIRLSDIENNYSVIAKKLNLNTIERELVQNKYIKYRIFAIAEGFEKRYYY